MFQILVVEDDKNTRLLMETVLTRYGYEPITAKDGEEALDILEKKQVDLIVLRLENLFNFSLGKL